MYAIQRLYDMVVFHCSLLSPLVYCCFLLFAMPFSFHQEQEDVTHQPPMFRPSSNLYFHRLKDHHHLCVGHGIILYSFSTPAHTIFFQMQQLNNKKRALAGFSIQWMTNRSKFPGGLPSSLPPPPPNPH